MLKPPKQFQPVAIETIGAYGKSTLPLFWVVLWRNLLMCLATAGSVSGSTSICPWLWPGKMLLAYWPVYKFDLILPVLFLSAFNVLTTITAYHLPLYQCVAIAFRILVLSVRFIVPSVVQCYLVHWLNILSIAWRPMMRVQHGFVFDIAWNLWGLCEKRNLIILNLTFLMWVTFRQCHFLSATTAVKIRMLLVHC